MTETTACPDRDRLSALLAGGLTEPEQAALARHLDGCGACQQALQRLASDREAWSETARQLHAVRAAIPPGPALQRVLAAFQAPDGPERTQAEPADTHDEELAFLGPPREAGHLGRLDHYEVLEVVGRGGFGIVLKAFDEALHRVVAIKVMAPQLAAVGSARKRFSREARAAAAVTHEHVVTIHAVEAEKAPPFLVMQYVAGRSLQERIDRTGPLELKEALRIGMQAAQGLAAAHAQGLVHRDVKPANILLENGVERVKLTDFGLARAADDASVTGSGVIAGTPMYMAPEQARGETVDHRADLFSLGSVLYAMCTGRPPFRASTTMGVIRLVSEQPAPPVREINPDVPESLAAVIERLHAKDPARRYQTAAEVAEVLERLLAQAQQPGGLALAAPTARPPRRPRKTGPFLKVLTALAVGVLVGGCVWLLLHLAFALRDRTVRDIIAEEAARNGGPPVPRPGPRQPDFAAGPPPPRPAPVVITPEPPPKVRPGEPLNDLALVSRPAPLAGVRSWALETTHHRAAVGDVAYSPDGRWLATACRGGAVRLWEAKTRRLVRILIVPGTTGQSLRGLAWAPDSRYLATCHQDGAVELWEAATGQLVRTLRCRGEVYTVAWSPDGRSLAGSGWIPDVPIWDVASGVLRGMLKGHTQGVPGLAWSPDGKKLATGSEDKTARVWDAETGQTLHTLAGHSGAVWAVAFSPDGLHLATAGFDKTVRVWRADQGFCVHTLRGHTDDVWSLAFSPDGKRLASGSADHTVRLWDPDSGKEVRPLVGHTHLVSSLSWSPDGQTLASGSWDTRVWLWPVEDGPGHTLPGNIQWAYNFPLWSPDGKYLATGAINARLWEAATGKFLDALPEHVGHTRAWSPDSKWLTTTDWKGGVWIWDVTERAPRSSMHSYDWLVRAAAWSPDGKLLATGNDGGIVLLWGANAGDKGWIKGNVPGWTTLPGHPPGKYGISAIAFAPDGATLAAGSSDGKVDLWDVKQQKPLFSRDIHKGAVKSLAWAPGGKVIATGGEDSLVKLWEPDTGKVLHTLPGFRGNVWALAFSPDGQTLATADGWNNVRLWSPATGGPLRRLHGPTMPVLSLTWSPDGRRLAGGGELATTHVWDVASGQVQAVLLGLPRDRALAVGASGHFRCTPGVERDLVYVVQTERGQETFTPPEFARKYGWQNDPEQVRPAGK
jgi:WD40 repeat protein